jgi:hypothetical protein
MTGVMTLFTQLLKRIRNHIVSYQILKIRISNNSILPVMPPHQSEHHKSALYQIDQREKNTSTDLHCITVGSVEMRVKRKRQARIPTGQPQLRV